MKTKRRNPRSARLSSKSNKLAIKSNLRTRGSSDGLRPADPSPDTLKTHLEAIRASGAAGVDLPGIGYIRFEPLDKGQKQPVPDLAADQLVSPTSIWDELTDEEIAFYSTPHFDELMEKKAAAEQRVKEGKQ